MIDFIPIDEFMDYQKESWDYLRVFTDESEGEDFFIEDPGKGQMLKDGSRFGEGNRFGDQTTEDADNTEESEDEGREDDGGSEYSYNWEDYFNPGGIMGAWTDEDYEEMARPYGNQQDKDAYIAANAGLGADANTPPPIPNEEVPPEIAESAPELYSKSRDVLFSAQASYDGNDKTGFELSASTVQDPDSKTVVNINDAPVVNQAPNEDAAGSDEKLPATTADGSNYLSDANNLNEVLTDRSDDLSALETTFAAEDAAEEPNDDKLLTISEEMSAAELAISDLAAVVEKPPDKKEEEDEEGVNKKNDIGENQISAEQAILLQKTAELGWVEAYKATLEQEAQSRADEASQNAQQAPETDSDGLESPEGNPGSPAIEENAVKFSEDEYSPTEDFGTTFRNGIIYRDKAA